jgi:hypothetical protein
MRYIGYGVLDGIRQKRRRPKSPHEPASHPLASVKLERHEAGVANVQVWVAFDQEHFVYFSRATALLTQVVDRQVLTDRKIGNLQRARGAVGKVGCIAFHERSDEDLRLVTNRVCQPDVVRRLIDRLQHTRERVAFETFGIPTGKSSALLSAR